MPNSAHHRLVALLRERSVRTGRFTLASGRESDLYVDARQTTLYAEGLCLIAELLWDRLHPEARGVGGPVTGADPIVGAVTMLSWQKHVLEGSQGRDPVHGFLVRKAPKGHGTRQWLEGRGNLPDGSPVCMIEDTVTTGGSLVKAIERVEEAGLRVVQCVCVVDREEGASEALEAAGYSLEALVGRAELLG